MAAAAVSTNPNPTENDLLSRLLPPPFSTSSNLDLITQGAEGLLYRTTFLSASTPAALKIRPAKPWRHPILDKRLTRARILAEARVLAKCRREGVAVPAILALDWENGWMCCEWIAGATVKAVLRRRHAAASVAGVAAGADKADGKVEMDKEALKQETGGNEKEKDALGAILAKIGRAVGKLHSVGIIHGDLTTSNMMLRSSSSSSTSAPSSSAESDDTAEVVEAALLHDENAEIVLIDFGLAVQAVQEEDRAVDLYVLERAFGATHPKEEERFGEVLDAYRECYKGAKATLKRLEDVRLRGRKKSMIG